MKYKSTLILLVAVGVAGLVAYSLSKKPTSEEVAKTRKKLLPDFHTADVRQLTIESADGSIVCHRESADEWRIQKPLDVRADRWQVEGILDKLETAEKVSSTFPEAGASLDMAQYGLKDPTRTVIASVDEAGKPTWTLRIGKPTGVGDTTFVAVDGEEGVFAVKKDVADKTDATLMGLRSKALAPRISSFDLESLTLAAATQDGQPPVEIACKKADNRWEMDKPVHDLCDKRAIEALANKLYDHRIGNTDFVVDDPTKAADYGLDHPALTVTLAGKDKSQTVLFASKSEGDKAEWYALTKGEPSIVRVPSSLLDALQKKPADLRERTLADIRPDDVEEIAVAGAPGELVLTKKDNAWEIGGEPATPADKDAVDELLKDLKGLEVKDFTADDPKDLAPYGLGEKEAVSVTLRDAGGKELAALSFGKADEAGEVVYAKRAGYPCVLAVPKGDYRAVLGRGRVAFLERRLLNEPRSAARRIVLTRGKEHFESVWNKEGAAWDLVKPVTGPADRYAVQGILGDMAPLRAAAIVAEQADDLAPYGLDAPAIVLEVSYEAEKAAAAEGQKAPESRVRTLQVGAETQEPAKGCFARLADDKRVFVLPDTVLADLRADLASREVCRAPELTGLSFQMGDAILSFTFDKDSETWKDAQGGALAGDMKSAVEGAAALLKDLRAVRVADYVEKAAGLYGFDKPFLTVTLDEATTKGKRVVIGSEAPGGGRYVKGPETGYVDVISEADASTLAAICMPPKAAQ
jgi:hypothetical protein